MCGTVFMFALESLSCSTGRCKGLPSLWARSTGHGGLQPACPLRGTEMSTGLHSSRLGQWGLRDDKQQGLSQAQHRYLLDHYGSTEVQDSAKFYVMGIYV